MTKRDTTEWAFLESENEFWIAVGAADLILIKAQAFDGMWVRVSKHQLRSRQNLNRDITGPCEVSAWKTFSNQSGEMIVHIED